MNVFLVLLLASLTPLGSSPGIAVEAPLWCHPGSGVETPSPYYPVSAVEAPLSGPVWTFRAGG